MQNWRYILTRKICGVWEMINGKARGRILMISSIQLGILIILKQNQMEHMVPIPLRKRIYRFGNMVLTES
jgi:hypothetical protein